MTVQFIVAAAVAAGGGGGGGGSGAFGGSRSLLENMQNFVKFRIPLNFCRPKIKIGFDY